MLDTTVERKTEVLPPQPVSIETWDRKYRYRQEASPAATMRRVSEALATNEGPVDSYLQFVFNDDIPTEVTDAESLFDWAHGQGMVLAGRPNAVLGTDIQATAINCFVQGIADTMHGFVDGRPGIIEAYSSAARTLKCGGGVGYSFSSLRPWGSMIQSQGTSSSGPAPFMEMFGALCGSIQSAGQRRGAQMAVLSASHPDILAFIHCKDDIRTMDDQKKPMAKFNISVLVPDALIEAAVAGETWELYHEAEPDPSLVPDAYRRDNGMWVYSTIPARELMNEIVTTNYNSQGEPGVLFEDTINRNNPLKYAEYLNACNPCAEQMLPENGCCDLGQVNLTRLVRDPFTPEARFDYETFSKVVKVLTRALDNILDITMWPLDEQELEAKNKRRTGAGFLGLGDALVMMGLKYDSDEGRAVMEKIAKTEAISAYEASIELAKERGSFPLLDAKKHVKSPIVQRMPKHIRKGILEHGLRNSHLLSIAPTGTISLAMADNASNGIEPAFAWSYMRNVLMPDGTREKVAVKDHALRMFIHLGCPGVDAEAVQKAVEADDHDALVNALPDYFRSARQIRVKDHLAAMAVVQPWIDSSISKTVNVPEDYPFDDFEDMYFEAHRLGLKSVAAYREQKGMASVLSVSTTDKPPESDDPDRIVKLEKPARLPSEAIVFAGRPDRDEGHEGRTWKVRGSSTQFFLTCNTHDGTPFEVLTTGAEAPRGADVLAKLLSLDMHVADIGFVIAKLESLSRIDGGEPVKINLGTGERTAPSPFAAMALLVRDYIEKLGVAPALDTGPVLDARLCKKGPKSVEGVPAKKFDIHNPHTDDDFAFFLAEYDIDGLGRWPLEIWLSGKYPKSWDGISMMLSKDMQVADPAWIARKLRAMVNVPEHGGGFMAKVPGEDRQKSWPSTLAYMAAVMLYRYAQIGLLTAEGYPVGDAERVAQAVDGIIHKGKVCPSCGNHTLVKRDGCEVCDECGHTGICG